MSAAESGAEGETNAAPGEGRRETRRAGRLVNGLAGRLAAERARWVLWLPVGIGTGIAVYFSLYSEPARWAGFLTLIPTLGLAWLGRKHLVWIALGLGLASISLGFAAAQLRAQRVAAPVLLKRLGPVDIEGRLIAVEPREKGSRLVLGDLAIEGLADSATPVRIRVFARGRIGSILPGDRLALRAILLPLSAPVAPGSFDFQRYAYFERLGALGFALGTPRIVDAPQRAGWWAAIERTRQIIFERVTAAAPGAAGAISAALIMGEQGAIPADAMQAWRDSGLAHLLSISGIHLSLVAAIFFFAVRAALALVPWIALRWPIKKIAAAVALIGDYAYLLISGESVPAERSFLMTGLVLLAVIVDRSALSMRSIAWAAVLLMLLYPESLIGPSFQMSFAAVLALIALYEVWRVRPKHEVDDETVALRWAKRIALGAVALAMTSLVASLATTPYSIFHFGRFAIYGVAANMIAVPLTSIWVMPLAVAAVAAMPFGLEHYPVVAMAWGVELTNRIALTVAGWSDSAVGMAGMSTAGLVAITLAGAWLCLWRGPWRFWAVPALAVAAILAIVTGRQPDLLASEDGKMVAVRTDSGLRVLTANRGEKFTRMAWRRYFGEGSLDPEAKEAPAIERTGPDPAEGEAAAEDSSETIPPAADGIRCDDAGCEIERGGLRIAYVTDGRALAESCATADIVISQRPVYGRCRGPTRVIDRFDLWRGGVHALWLPDGARDDGSNRANSRRIRVTTARELQGERPWVPSRPRRATKRDESGPIDTEN